MRTKRHIVEGASFSPRPDKGMWLSLAPVALWILFAMGCSGLRMEGGAEPPGPRILAASTQNPLWRRVIEQEAGGNILDDSFMQRALSLGGARTNEAPGLESQDSALGDLTIVSPDDPDHPGAHNGAPVVPLVFNQGAGQQYPVERGIASYYNRKSYKTAWGKLHDPAAMTAAHRTLPFGTVARCTRLDTGASVVVTISDRGPHVRGRIIDLSQAAAKKIGLDEDGIARCEVHVIGYPVPQKKDDNG